jgi:hypothetical protein
VAGALIGAGRLGPDRSHVAPVGVSALAVLGTPLALGALPLVEPFDRQAGRPVVAALLKVAAAGLRAERPVGVGNAVALPVLLDARDRLLPATLPLDRGGRLAELTQP